MASGKSVEEQMHPSLSFLTRMPQHFNSMYWSDNPVFHTIFFKLTFLRNNFIYYIYIWHDGSYQQRLQDNAYQYQSKGQGHGNP